MPNHRRDGDEQAAALLGGLGDEERWGGVRPRPVRAPDPLADAVGRVAGGDRQAFEEVYDALAPKVLGLAWSVLRNRAMAEEVAQDVMLEVWRQAARFDPSLASVSTWVMTIAHRRAVDRVRSVRASEDREDRAVAGDAQREFDEVVETTLQREDEQRVRRALGTLTDLQRQAVELAYWGGRTSVEISRMLGVPVPTVKTRLRDGLIRLRASLGGLS